MLDQFYIAIALSLALYMSVKDIKTYSIPLWTLCVWILMAVFKTYQNPNILLPTYVCLFIAIALIYAYQQFRSYTMVANADLVCILGCAPLITTEKTPIFLFLIAISAQVYSFILKTKKVPLIPFIMLSGFFVHYISTIHSK